MTRPRNWLATIAILIVAVVALLVVLAILIAAIVAAKLSVPNLYAELVKWQTAIAAVLGFGGLIVAARFGLHDYFRQKEYELVKERYLEGAIDIVASESEQSLDIFVHNWTRCLNILKAFRDEGESFDLKELYKGFRDLEPSIHRLPNHRIGDLVGSQVIWDVYQIVIAFAANKNSILTKEIPDTIRLELGKQFDMAGRGVIVARTVGVLQEMEDASRRFTHLTHVLHRLSRMLEKERMTFKSVGEFREHPEVKTLLLDLQRDFAKDLADDGEE